MNQKCTVARRGATAGLPSSARCIDVTAHRYPWRLSLFRVAMIACTFVFGSTLLAADPPAVAPSDENTSIPELQGVLTGIDILKRDRFAPLAGRRVGLITNHTGRSRDGQSTVKLLHDAPGVTLVALFSPEHGIAGKLDVPGITDTDDAVTGLRVFSLYGKTRVPTPDSLRGIDTLVFDIQDIGTRFYTYMATMGGAMEAAAAAGIRFVVLDRPNPIGGASVEGPLLDSGRESFVSYHRLPVRHGMTVGELAGMFNAERKIGARLTVVKLEGWRRADYFDACGLLWINPSPNMRSLTQALLYPGIGLLETTNVSVGRGTDTPFEVVGAPWIDGRRLAAALHRAELPGVRFVPIEFTPVASKYSKTMCQGVNVIITVRAAFRPLPVGFEIAAQLWKQYPDKWDFKAYDRLLRSDKVLGAIESGRTGLEIDAICRTDVERFRQRRKQFLLYE